MRRWRRIVLLALVAVPLGARMALAIDASNVLVLYNPGTDGQQIAEYYQQIYPGVQLLPITGLGTSEDITADTYLNIIRPQVLPALTPTKQVIVTTKGLPLRINVTQPQPPGGYTEPPPNNTPHTISSWKTYSSLESELAAIDRISMWEMMGDQSYTLPNNAASNPYYLSNTPFTHAQYGTRLTARLDGYTVEDVIGAIDRAQEVFVGPSNNSSGPAHFVVDNDPTRPYQATITALASDLANANLPVTYENTTAFQATAPGPVIGYASHGDHQAAAPDNYLTAGVNFNLADGAVFTSIESYNAYSFNAGGYTGSQGQVAQWLQIGGTAGVGNVEEPTASWNTLTNEHVLFDRLLDGMTFAEAAWAANRQVSWVNTVIGDPLMQWRTLLKGDINRDGFVDISDLAIMGAHWDEDMQSGGFGWTLGDINSDGTVDISDLAILGAHWGAQSSWAGGTSNMAGVDESELGFAIQQFIVPVPEPSSWALAAFSGLGLFLWRRLAARRRRHYVN
jgi:uncharacterized protein (TIGR03790 family)